MITGVVKSQLLAFSVLTVVGVSYVGAEYAGLADAVFDDSYTVQADFAESGGIFSGAEVTYRGVPVGRVGDLGLRKDGVAVELDLEDGPSIPADTLAVVANRSAIGEQYVDLQPRSDDGPYLDDGSSIDRADTRTPLPATDLVLGLDRMVNSVDRKDLRVTVDELGKAFSGSGRDLSRMVDSGNALIDTADDSLPQTVELIEDSRTVLRTQRDKGSAIKSFSRDLADLTQTLKGSDADIRKLIDNGAPAAHQLDSLLKANRKSMPVLLGNLISGGQITTARLPNLEQVLVTFPAVVAGSYTVQPGDGTTHFGMVVNADDPPACKRGYGTRWRDPSDMSERRANTSARCAEPRGSKTSVRGAQNAPRPSGGYGAGGAGQASYFAPYDAQSGVVQGPDGRTVRIGTTGGQQSAYGKDSWQWLLVGPMT